MATYNEKELKLIEMMRLNPKSENSMVVAKHLLVKMGLVPACDRCGGSGRMPYNHNVYKDMCLKCYGSGYALPRLTKKYFEEIQKAIDAGKLDEVIEEIRWKREAKKKIKELKKQAERVYAESEIYKDYHNGNNYKNPVIKMLIDRLNELLTAFYDIIRGFEKNPEKEFADITIGAAEIAIKNMQEFDEAYRALKEGRTWQGND